MHLQKGDMGGVMVSEDQPKTKTTRINNKTDYKIQPDKRKDLWGRRICSDYPRMSYWQKVSNWTFL